MAQIPGVTQFSVYLLYVLSTHLSVFEMPLSEKVEIIRVAQIPRVAQFSVYLLYVLSTHLSVFEVPLSELVEIISGQNTWCGLNFCVFTVCIVYSPECFRSASKREG